MSAATMALLLLGTLPGPGLAQVSDTALNRTSPALVKYGKWVGLVAAVGMGIKASDTHHDADRAYSRLQDYCDLDHTRCNQSSNGSYLDPVAERYYQSSLRSDRRARAWLLSGEVTVLATAGLFVWELTRPKRPPRNIPFAPEFRVAPGQARFGLRATF